MSFLRRFTRVRPIQQMEAAECGVACLAMVLEYHGSARSLPELRQSCGTSRDGNSALGLLEGARQLGLVARGVSVAAEDLDGLEVPAILHWDMNHFVVLEWANGRRARIVDPASGRRSVGWPELERLFSGVALELAPSSDLPKRAARSPSSARYLALLSELWKPLAFVLLANVGQQLFATMVPAASQVLIDHVIQPSRSHWLLPTLAVVACAIIAEQPLEYLRVSAQASLRARIGLALTDELSRRLLALPLPFIDSRGRGDLLGRVHQQAELPALLTRSVQAGFDVLFVLLLAALMLAYDLFLGTLALVLAALRVLFVRIASAANQQRAAAELAARGREHGALLEATCAPEMVKALGLEARVVERYAQRVTERAHWSMRSDRLHDGVASSLSVLGGAMQAILLWFGGKAVIEGAMTIGVFAGFLAIRAMIEPPLGSLFSLFSSWARFRSALERSDDIMSVPAARAGELGPPCVAGEFRLENVGFRYGSGGSWVFRNVTLSVAPGEHVVLMGPSGHGKSTLAKLMCGLLEPTEGRVLLNGVEIRDYERAALARRLGVVLEEPFVLEGSVAENVSLRIPEATPAQLRLAAELACFAEVVARMPGGYETELVKQGRNLSGGERQRLAIAQAVLGSPDVLVLDEATSALDLETEQRLMQNLGALLSTRISVAHRPTVAMHADRLFIVSEGRVVETAPLGSHIGEVSGIGYAAPHGGSFRMHSAQGAP